MKYCLALLSLFILGCASTEPIVPRVLGTTSAGLYFRADCNTIVSPVTGNTLCWNQTASVLQYWNGTAWTNVTTNGGGGGLTNPLTTTLNMGSNSIINLVGAASAGQAIAYGQSGVALAGLSLQGQPTTNQGSASVAGQGLVYNQSAAVLHDLGITTTETAASNAASTFTNTANTYFFGNFAVANLGTVTACPSNKDCLIVIDDDPSACVYGHTPLSGGGTNHCIALWNSGAAAYQEIVGSGSGGGGNTVSAGTGIGVVLAGSNYTVSLLTPLAQNLGGTGSTTPGGSAGNGLTHGGTFPNESYTLTTPVSVANGGRQCGAPVAFASLPGSPTEGEECEVTDATACIANTPVTAGGGATKCVVNRIGANWMPGGGVVSSASGGVQSVTGTPPVTSTGGINPAVGLTLPLAQQFGGTGTGTAPSLVAGPNMSVSGLWPNQTISSSAGPNVTQICSLNCTTTGTIVCYQPWGAVSLKQTVCNAVACQNASSTPQTCPYSVPFTSVPAAVIQSNPPASSSTTTLTLMKNQLTPYTGPIIYEGF